ncbi:hypothetical protein GWI33_016967 [Rhynchophorus ferrugineus]|uniref:Uncharacterized protein n=1 Tax=Rhynchophorus ferrugineus TaxID=354439 RepID=A0A834HWH2_RHYFE|nr:hypothetical protein GWI33_016967 [Rhynchophorus ferrugineus]
MTEYQMEEQHKDEHIRHLKAQIAILQNQVPQLINTKMTTGVTDNEMIKTTKNSKQAPIVRENSNLSAEKKRQRRLKSTTTTDDEFPNLNNSSKQQAKRQAVDKVLMSLLMELCLLVKSQ